VNFDNELDPDRDPPPLPPGYGSVLETPPLPAGYGEREAHDEPATEPEPEPVPRRKRGFAVRVPVIFVFLAAALLGLYFGPGSRVVRFVDDRGRVPADFVATLRRGDTEKLLVVENGRLRVLRLRWDTIEITDLSYIGESYELKGKDMLIHIERNTSRKLKDAAHGAPSVPQRGDPDPARDR